MTAAVVLNLEFPRCAEVHTHDACDALDVVRALGAQPWCAGLDLTGLVQIARHAEVLAIPGGEAILSERTASKALYVVLAGTAVVEKSGAVLAELEAGAVFGEMSFLDGNAASATVRALTDTRVLRLDRDRFDRVPALAAIKHQLVAALALEVVGRLRTLGDTYVETARAKSEETRRRADLGKLFIVTVALFGIGQITQRLITPAIPPLLHMAYSWGFLLVIAGMFAAFVRAQHAPIAAFGLTRAKLERSLAEGTAIGLAVIAVFTAFRTATISAGESLVTWGSAARFSDTEATIFFSLYLPHCFLQELIARGVLQGSLERLIPRRFAGLVITSAMFGIFHLHVSLSFAALTFVASLAFGALYRRHKNLAGVTALHFLLGLAATAFGMN